MDLKDTYNKIATDWHKDHQSDDWWVEGTNKFIGLLKPGALVLDVGCAGGFKSAYLIEHGLRVVGIDIAENFIEIAKREVPTGKFLVAGMEEIPSLEGEFDAIFIQAVLLHAPHEKVKGILVGAFDKLRSGGFLYVAVKEQREGQAAQEVKSEDDYGYKYERFFSYFTLPQLEKVFTEIGFKIVYTNVAPTGKTRWIQIIGQK